ncbi:MAG: hypothetical protein ACTHJR_11615 [Sphingomonas sp.]|uniref:hypothetical protein n=1 Tax=Sphingomonas sp. TaxID=28214 RepID=UPI003F7DB070
MILHTKYSVFFPISGLTLKGEFSPPPGITAVVGRNGSGKTFGSIEVTRYALFGKAALRGVASDYKNLVVDASYMIRDKRVDIHRGTKETLHVDGEIKATGASAVNAKVVELLGYDLAVFDICNASVQKGADVFGKLGAPARKKLIDQVVGITDVEQTEKLCRDKARTLKLEAEAMSRTLITPVAPVTPCDYRNSTTLAEELAAMQQHNRQRAELEALLILPAEPERPANPLPSDGDIARLKHHEDERHKREWIIRSYKDTIEANSATTPYTEAELDAALARVTAPECIVCPNCDFKIGAVEIPDGPDLGLAEIGVHRQALQEMAKREEYLALLAKVEAEPLWDRSEELEAMLTTQREWNIYTPQEARYLEALGKVASVCETLSHLAPAYSEELIEDVREARTRAMIYENELHAYEAALETYEKVSNEIAGKLTMSDEFKKGAQALAEGRAELKTLLAPILSQVASNLIDKMTNSELYDVVVDEDMEITVNGQRLETLSGAGETVANIALRVALGQILVGKTFPVFIGDEMDSDADSERREATAKALTNLRENLEQIILVTHRSVEIADHVIDMDITT